MSRSSSTFRAAAWAHAHLAKSEHDPFLLAVIAIVEPAMRGFWTSVTKRLVRAILEKLAAIPETMHGAAEVAPLAHAHDTRERRRALHDLLAALLLLWDNYARSPLSVGQQGIVREGALAVLETGAESAGGRFDPASARGHELLQLVEQDLELAIRSRLLDPAVRNQVEAHLFDYLSNQTLRDTGTPPVAFPVPSAALPTPREKWVQDLKALIAPPQHVALATDAWAYRGRAIGTLAAAEASGAQELVAVAQIDERTTSFCRWVDGKPVAVSAALAQLSEFARAVRAQNTQAAMKAWPLDGLRQDTRGLGLPPYHFNCRTHVRPR